ncbi:ExbD/TolR family protein [Methylophilus luteus]|jgi:biopolymer transport protein ExbD|uniref:ExbD/TolR family protein n=1 Tax=Methylophilus luteus TaxID=640108 RepID=A0ABW3F1Y5_9PROT
MAISTNADDDVLSEINVTPLVDVMLVLLVAFIVTAPLMTNSIQVNLPKTSATKTTEQKKPVTVSVDAAGKLFIDKQEYPLENIEPELKRIHDSNPDVTLHLSSDEAVNYGKVAKVMAAIERAGISRVAVLTQAE